MIRVCFFSNFGDCQSIVPLLERQTPEFKGRRFRNLQVVNPDQPYDYAVVFNWPTTPIRCPASHVLGFLMEPPEIESLNLERLAGIGHYFTPVAEHKAQLGKRFNHTVMRMILHTPIYHDEVYLPSKKAHRMSMIVSGKTITPFQRKRVELFEALKASQLPIDFYGRDLIPGSDRRIKGPLPSVDKQKGLADYAMSLAFENTSVPECISEKLYDCAVNNCVPITNAPGASKYLPHNSYVHLDFNRPTKELVDQIARLLKMSVHELIKFDKGVIELKRSILHGNLSLMEFIFKTLTSLHRRS